MCSPFPKPIPAFLLFLLVHLVIIIWRNNVAFTRSAWLRLNAALPVALFLLFTGYILRGDATGEAAGAIAENITRSIPLFSALLNNLFFDGSTKGVQKVYLNHLSGLMVLGGICVWPHLRRYTALWRDHLPLTLVLLVFALVLKTPLEHDHFGLLHIAGPWFFLGLQELLRYLPVFWAGIAAPAIPVALLLLLPAQGQSRRMALWGISIWLIGYTVFSIIGWQRG